jgi:glyceraldehyde 3-phosphate dehydrogenase
MARSRHRRGGRQRLIINGKRIQVTAEKDPANLPHAANGIDIALECTGFFVDRESAGKHLTAGAKRVLISAPARRSTDRRVRREPRKLTADDLIVSNASCTTNCLAPFAKVLHEAIGIERGLMTTIHSYTNDQKILDQIHKDPRRPRRCSEHDPHQHRRCRGRGRGSARTEGQAGRFVDPRADPERFGRRSDFSPSATRPRGSERLLKAAAEGPLKGVLGYTEEPLVSGDFNHDPHSSTIDSLETAVLEGKLVRVLSWYDNEWGFSNRMVDTAAMGKLL